MNRNKILIIGCILILLLAGCGKETGAGDTQDNDIKTVAVENGSGSKPEKAVSAKKPAKTVKQETYSYTDNKGKTYELPISYDGKAMVASEIPENGIISQVAIIPEKNDYIKAFIVKQKVTARTNKWDPSVMDYYIEGRVYADCVDDENIKSNWTVTSMDRYVKRTKDDIRPIVVEAVRMENIVHEKIWDHFETPIDQVTFDVVIDYAEDEYTMYGEDYSISTDVCISDWGIYADEAMPYFFDTVRIMKNGMPGFPLDDTARYYTVDNVDFRRVEVPDPTNFFGFHYEDRAIYYGTITDLGYQLLEALMKEYVKPEVFASEDFQVFMQENLSKSDKLHIISSLYSCSTFDDFIDIIADVSGYDADIIKAYVDYDKLNEKYLLDVAHYNYVGGDTDEEYRANYGLDK